MDSTTQQDQELNLN